MLLLSSAVALVGGGLGALVLQSPWPPAARVLLTLLLMFPAIVALGLLVLLCARGSRGR